MVSHVRRNEKAGQTWPEARLALVAAPALPADHGAEAGQRRLQGGPQPSVARPDAIAATTDRLSPETKHAFGSARPVARSPGAADAESSNDPVRILDDICRERARNPDAAFAAVLRLATLLTAADAGAPPSAHGAFAPWQRRKVERYFQESLTQPLRAQELAKRVALSVSHFYRAFKRTFGATPHAHMIRLRLKMAQELMVGTNDPLSQIALACGFADQSHLSKQFRRSLGQTPSAWRRQHFGEAGAAHRRS
jgi:AraC family transcriptional regulator